jgi:hypothetical protein
MTASIALAAVWSAAICCGQTALAERAPLPVRSFQMVDEGLYRSAQPTARRAFATRPYGNSHSPRSARRRRPSNVGGETGAQSRGMQYMHVALAGYQAATQGQITAALRILRVVYDRS